MNFLKLLGINTSKDYQRANEQMQRELAELFNSDQGQRVLAWLFHSNVIQAPSTQKMTDAELHYNAGKIDMIKYIYALTNFNYEEQ